MAHRSRPDPDLVQVVNDRLAHLLGDRLPRRAREPARPPETHQPVPGPSQAEHTQRAQLPDPVEPVVDLPPLRRFSHRHLGVVGVLLVLALICAGWALFRARPVAVASPAYPVSVSPPQPGPSAATPRARDPAAAEIVVHVLGAVRRPGLVRLPAGARVQDAIEATGGMTRSADPGDLNLAQLLTDGQQIVIGTRRRPAGEVRDSGAGESDPSQPGQARAIDLNRATQAQLEQLPGVGPVTAASILGWRQQHGRFTRIEELQEVDGIGPKTYAQIAPHVRV